MPGAAETMSFVVKTLLRPDGERVARQAVEALAVLAAAAALNWSIRGTPNCSRCAVSVPGAAACTARRISRRSNAAACSSARCPDVRSREADA